MFPLHIKQENEKHKYVILVHVHVQSGVNNHIFGGTITMLQMLGNRKLP